MTILNYQNECPLVQILRQLRPFYGRHGGPFTVVSTFRNQNRYGSFGKKYANTHMFKEREVERVEKDPNFSRKNHLQQGDPFLDDVFETTQLHTKFTMSLFRTFLTKTLVRPSLASVTEWLYSISLSQIERYWRRRYVFPEGWHYVPQSRRHDEQLRLPLPAVTWIGHQDRAIWPNRIFIVGLLEVVGLCE